MADFSHRPAPTPGQIAPPPPVHSEEDLTHMRSGPLGNMAVVPDDYVGSMPPNAVRATDYQRMTAVYSHIDSGHSQLSIDTTGFMKDAEGKELNPLEDPAGYVKALVAAQQFRDEKMGYLKDLVKTPAGLQMLESLDQSKHTTTIAPRAPDGMFPGSNMTGATNIPDTMVDPATGRAGKGSDTRVELSMLDEPWDNCGGPQEPWMVDRKRLGMYHELVHAYHDTRGDVPAGDQPTGYAMCSDMQYGIGDVEFQTVGLGSFAGEAVSENAIRAQMGIPLRPSYMGATPGSPKGVPQATDDEEPPVRSPRR